MLGDHSGGFGRVPRGEYLQHLSGRCRWHSPISQTLAVAKWERVTVLHYGGDYDLIAKITGQSARRAVPAHFRNRSPPPGPAAA